MIRKTYRSHGTDFISKRVGSDGRGGLSLLGRGKGGRGGDEGGKDSRLHFDLIILEE